MYMRGEERGAETGAVAGAMIGEGVYGDGGEEDGDVVVGEMVVGEGAEADMVEGAGTGAKAGATAAGVYAGTAGDKPEGAGAPDGVIDPLSLPGPDPAASLIGPAAGATTGVGTTGFGTYTTGEAEGPDTGAAAGELGEPYTGGPVGVPDMGVATMGAAAGPVATVGLLAGTGVGTAGVRLSAGVGEGVAAGVSVATGAGAGAAGVGVGDTLVGVGEGLWREASGAPASGVADASAGAAAVGVGVGEATTTVVLAVVLAMTGEAAGVGDATGGRGMLSSSPVAESRTAMDLAGVTVTAVATVVPRAGELTVIG